MIKLLIVWGSWLGLPFAALGTPAPPLFAVPGKHSAARPGSDLTDPLLAALGEAGARTSPSRPA